MLEVNIFVSFIYFLLKGGYVLFGNIVCFIRCLTDIFLDRKWKSKPSQLCDYGKKKYITCEKI